MELSIYRIHRRISEVIVFMCAKKDVKTVCSVVHHRLEPSKMIAVQIFIKQTYPFNMQRFLKAKNDINFR